MKSKGLPLETRRSYVWQDMNAIAQETTRAIHEKLRIANKRDLLVRHSIGTILKRAFSKVGVYGQDFPKQFALVSGFARNLAALGDMKNFAAEYSRQFVLEQADEPMANGAFVSYEHLLELMKISSLKRRGQFLEKTRVGGLSVTQLRRVIAADRKTVGCRKGD